MNSDLITRRYTQPIPVSATTALHYRQFKNSTSVASTLGSIPESSDLLKIKADLESLLPLSEKRIRHLQHDLSFIKKNVRIKEQSEEDRSLLDKQEHSTEKTGKSKLPSALNKMLIKQETTDESSDMLHVNSHNKSQIERQLALEALRRKRRRDDDSKGGTQKTKNMSPHLMTKVKKTDDASPVMPSAKPQSKSNQHSHTKKKKSIEQNNLKRSCTPAHQEVDFVRVKAKDQIPILTFWSTIDPHFRPLEEEDRQFLMANEEDEQFYKIPPLGRHYTEVWSEDESLSTLATNSSQRDDHSSVKHRYLRDHQPMVDDHLLCNDMSCGQLTERLLSSLVPDPSGHQEAELEDDDSVIMDENDVIVERNYHNNKLHMVPPENIVDFEENLKRELRYAGLFGEDDVDWDTREDDEICAELRSTIRELKGQFATNEYRKKRLLEIVDNQLQYEQYRHVLDNLDAQVEQFYLKRFVGSIKER
ncbi:MAG: histone acetyltransferases subunit 3-domain-containing protein [Benjaminiella poitrasii]|nr:MAG: histone acetyltransferases subunit 3-domain-containing protein [Benjaminiella poitrasii]